MQPREHLAGIEQSLVIECTLESLLLLQVCLAEHFRHQVTLLDADAVLAGEHAADLDAEAQDRGAELLGPLQFAWFVGVIEDQRVKIAIAGMEHVCNPQLVSGREVAHAGKHQR